MHSKTSKPQRSLSGRSITRPATARPQDVAAFTLIELLSVIAIIGILVAILIPVTASVRKLARVSKCTSTIRQYAIATQLYVNDHKGQLPRTAWNAVPGGGWYGHYDLFPYFNMPPGVSQKDKILMFSCPEGWQYGLNAFTSAKPMTVITDPSRHILATCSVSGWLDGQAISGANEYLKRTPKPHSGKVNVVTFSGSVTLRKVSTLRYADIKVNSTESTYVLGGDPQYDK